MVENIVIKEDNAGNQHFLFFPQSFLKNLIHMDVKNTRLCWQRLKQYNKSVERKKNLFR